MGEGEKKLGILAPSAPVNPERFAQGVRYVESLGLKVTIAGDPTTQYGRKDFLFSSDSAAARRDALHQLYSDSEVFAVLAARGAYGAMEILPLIDWNLLSRWKKPLCGLSDTTALLVSAIDQSGLTVIHGPSLESAFSKAAHEPLAEESARCLVEILLEKRSSYDVTLRLLCGPAVASLQGIMVGGNLTMLSALCGTPWQPDFKGKLLFIEEIGEKPYRIHRSLLQLSLSGAFEGLKGVLLGEFLNCEHASGLGPSCEEVVTDILGKLSIPVFQGFPGGHGLRNLPLPLGRRLTITPEKISW